MIEGATPDMMFSPATTNTKQFTSNNSKQPEVFNFSSASKSVRELRH
jgi:hypothetical protein